MSRADGFARTGELSGRRAAPLRLLLLDEAGGAGSRRRGGGGAEEAEPPSSPMVVSSLDPRTSRTRSLSDTRTDSSCPRPFARPCNFKSESKSSLAVSEPTWSQNWR